MNTRKIDVLAPFLAVLLGMALPASAQSPGALDCTGPLARESDEEALVKAFGAANVERADIDIGEGFTEPGTVIFATDRTRRIEILWHDGAQRRRPSVILLRSESAWGIPVPGMSDQQIAIGATLADVEAANGAPFTILGFGWDNGGYADGWRGGRLDKPIGGCSLSLRFDSDSNAPPAALGDVNGDKEFLSSDAAMRAVRPVVIGMEFHWPQ